MLHIILFLLKIFGCILLAILGLILILLLIVLFVPIRYDFFGNYYGTPDLSGRISWLFGAVKATAEFKDKELKICVKLLWKTLVDSKKEDMGAGNEDDSELNLPEHETTTDLADTTDSLQSASETVSFSNETNVSETISVSNSASKNESSAKTDRKLYKQKENKKRKENKEKVQSKNDKKSKNNGTKLSLIERLFLFIDSLTDRVDSIFENIEEKVEALSCKINKIERFICAECTQKSLLFIKRMLASILKHIAPNKVQGKIHFGLDKPSTTGKILGYASAFYPLYAHSIQLIPDFENKIIEGELALKGSIRLYIFVVWAIKALLCKDIRKLIKFIKHLKK